MASPTKVALRRCNLLSVCGCIVASTLIFQQVWRCSDAFLRPSVRGTFSIDAAGDTAAEQVGPRRRALVGMLLATAGATNPDQAGAANLDTPFAWDFLYENRTDASEKKLERAFPIQIMDILQDDLALKRYILTGDLTPSIFSDDCHFEDPNNAVDGLSRYRQALGLLFDPAESGLRLKDIRLADFSRKIVAEYEAWGTLKLPWRPAIQPWSGKLVWTLGDDGLITSQVDTWNITRWDAIQQTFNPF
eukprot:TRINITY_DN16906_c0_g1_i1.p1 TRINITY_DN16906_c0_g1~~TRINITY_DN16906_c0_g1_i1.p1  ORF type:complete len:247 (-),score=47.61 TRINITY_DN16906_c0_g1_i1:277-1017(-)